MRRKTSDGNGSVLFTQVKLLKLQKNDQFPDEPTRIKGTQIHSVDGPRY
jgi:hypothetical protein